METGVQDGSVGNLHMHSLAVIFPPFLLLPITSLLSSPFSHLLFTSHSASLFSSPFPSSSHSLFVVFPARAPSNITQLTPEQVQMGIETSNGHDVWTQAGFQLALLGVTLGVSIFGGVLTGT